MHLGTSSAQFMLTCRNGHQWEPSEVTDTNCPSCGCGCESTDAVGDAAPSPADMPTRQTTARWTPDAAVWSWPEIPGYQILREIKAGGMGIVFHARQIALDRPVALKVISTLHADPELIARFLIEAQAIGRLQHPGIVQVYETGWYQGRPFLSMEFVGGGNLTARLAGKPQPPRAAAEMLRSLAQALHCAHQRKVVHRDLKPGNVLITAEGTLKVADFGLAKLLESDGSPTRTGDILGTIAYMAPEQAGGVTKHVGPACDIYSLGVVLYEMLTGRPPFVGVDAVHTVTMVLTKEPIAPRRLQPKLSRDLEAICLKCLEKRPQSRYASAQDLADDLGRFLAGRPTAARPANTLSRGLKWVGRNRGRAAAIAALTVAAVSLIWLRIAGLEALAFEQRRELAMRNLQAERLAAHAAGWSEKAWRHVTELAEMRRDDDLRNQAAATLAGIDATSLSDFAPFEASSVAFDGRGKRLLFGGGGQSGATVWDLTTDQPRRSQQSGLGPVAFSPDGAAWQLVARFDEGCSFLLWDVDRQVEVQSFELPGGVGDVSSPSQVTALALAADGSLAAASVAPREAPPAVCVWEAATGELLHRLEVDAGALAFSASSRRLAVGDKSGAIEVWPMQGGRPLQLPRLGRTPITALAFSPSSELSVADDEGPRGPDSILAAGNAGGELAVWDLAAAAPRVYCRGSSNEVGSLAFNADGTLLASADSGNVTLWDAASGKAVLELPPDYRATGLAFSPDATQLAVSSLASSGDPGGAKFWQLDDGRGLRTLRGLGAPVTLVCFSPDDRLAAALAHDWRIGVWDVARGRLLRLFDAPVGFSIDNAALAFSPDGRRFAFAAGTSAREWDVTTGERLEAWQLPPGLSDALAYHAGGKLLLARMETADGKNRPFGDATFDKAPRVGRLRDLHRRDPLRPIVELTEYNRHVAPIVAARDGSFLVIQGWHDGPDGGRRAVETLDGPTGRSLWKMPVDYAGSPAVRCIDSSSALVELRPGKPSQSSLFELATGRPVDTVGYLPNAMGPSAAYWMHGGPPPGEPPASIVSLYRRDDAAPLLRLGIDTQVSSLTYQFDTSGWLLAWGNLDGTVTVADIRALKRRLAGVGLGW